MRFSVILQFEKPSLFLLGSQNNTLDALMNKCYIKNITKLSKKVIFVLCLP